MGSWFDILAMGLIRQKKCFITRLFIRGASGPSLSDRLWRPVVRLQDRRNKTTAS